MQDPSPSAGVPAQSQTRAIPRSRWLAVGAALFLGIFILYGVGFASPDLLHNAAHDGRHAWSFPCH